MQKETGFGGKHLDKAVFDYICNHIPYGSGILELGSGWVTGQLAQHYTMYSIEENARWLDVYDSYYIHAPLYNSWYDVDVLARELPRIQYTCVLVDGPFRRRHRRNMVDHLWLFDPKAIFVFDEVQYDGIYNLMLQVANRLNHRYEVYDADYEQFGVTRPQR